MKLTNFHHSQHSNLNLTSFLRFRADSSVWGPPSRIRFRSEGKLFAISEAQELVFTKSVKLIWVNITAKDLVGSMEWCSARARKSTALSTEMFVAMYRMQISLKDWPTFACGTVRNCFSQQYHVDFFLSAQGKMSRTRLQNSTWTY